MNDIFLSIIIPLYNSQHCISKTLDNLLKTDTTSLSKIEIVLIDDGSSDKTKEECLSYKSKFQSFHYHFKENGGISSARNYGIQKSRGRYLFFHDHDDIFETHNLGSILKLVERCNEDLILFNSSVIENGRKKQFISINFDEGSVIDDEMQRTSILKTQFQIPIKNAIINRFGYIWSVLIKRTFVQENDIFFKTFVDFDDDFNFLAEALLHKAIIRTSDISIYNWVIYSNSTSHGFLRDESYLDKVKNYNTYLISILSGFKLTNKELSLACNNVAWDKYEEFLVVFFQDKHRKYSEFKSLIEKYDLRKELICKNTVKKSFNQRLLVTLLKLKLFRLVFFFIRLRTPHHG